MGLTSNPHKFPPLVQLASIPMTTGSLRYLLASLALGGLDGLLERDVVKGTSHAQ